MNVTIDDHAVTRHFNHQVRYITVFSQIVKRLAMLSCALD